MTRTPSGVSDYCIWIFASGTPDPVRECTDPLDPHCWYFEAARPIGPDVIRMMLSGMACGYRDRVPRSFR